MAAAASLFVSSMVDKQTLHRRITPSDEQFDEQTERWNELADFLRPELRAKSGYSTRTWLQGSYKFGTQIRPVHASEEFDIDLGFYFEWSGDKEDGEHGPKTLKSFVQDSLKKYAKEEASVVEVAEPKPRCARIRYENKFHIDVPVYHLSDGQERALATEEDNWEDSDPKAFYVWFKDSFNDAERVKVRRIIRYLKAWAALKFSEIKDRPSSILITIVAAEAALSHGADSLGDDDEAFAAIVSAIKVRFSGSREVRNPKNSAEDVGARYDSDQWSRIEDELAELDKVCIRALEQGTESEAADVWQEAFEHMFPMPETPPLERAAAKDEAYLPAVLFTPEVKVSAVSANNASIKYEKMNEIGPIPRNCTIKFQLVNFAALPPNSVVSWTVRNEGREAELKNDLGHVSSTGWEVSEHSEYKGRHFMDCTVRQYGVTIARRRIPVTINASEAPRRNPVSRPAWTKFRR